MSRARTYTKSEISDAAAAAASHNVRVVMHPNGEIEFAPKSFTAVDREDDTAEKALRKWQDGRQAGGRA
ncbi:hypothetical protein CHY08_07200 [Rhizobium leguminosarum bv. viciae]|jgi:hypothetical protein|uniref:hypothetical protein n=1 Tax=Rhizobium leguminosarum TaxID=384 RepID=UPI000B8CE4C5|nr:hypothetical protein [Rhizobium leguminosarum]ASR06923.1 hypothetical protein CHY08_07200 [Rhizobium leguminosarum bv. viciae]